MVDKKLEEMVTGFLRNHYKEVDGYFQIEIYPDYRDTLSDRQIEDILSSDDPQAALEEELGIMYESAQDFYKDDAVQRILALWEEEDDAEDIRQILRDCVVYILPQDHFLQQQVRADLVVDTGDGNGDFVANSVPMYAPGYWGYDVLPDEASLVWLAKTQGYSKTDLLAALDGRPCTGFLASAKAEVENEVSHMNALIFLAEISLQDLIRIREALAKAEKTSLCDTRDRQDVGSITIRPKAMCGLYAKWSGGGSLLDIQLEREVHLPIKFLREAVPDAVLYPYNIEDTYGMCHSAWRDVIAEVDVPKEIL